MRNARAREQAADPRSTPFNRSPHPFLLSPLHPPPLMSALKKLAGPLLRVAGSRAMATGEAPGRKVAVMGAAGGIGQPLSLLMKVRGREGAGGRAAPAGARRALFFFVPPPAAREG